MLARIGFARLERPVAALEAGVKGFLFDCRMCGDCVLSKTGMSCPMNCPKGLRNGPCGGVRANGHCEVYPEMPCVWVQAYEGSLGMREGAAIAEILPPLNHALKGSSAWIRLAREKAGARG
jgi:Methylene-tetrahydrofolate reductase C terminal